MKPHDWQRTDKEFLWKGLLEDYIIIVDPNLKIGRYICSRCGDEARVDDVSWPEARATPNWRADCDETLVQKVHES